MNQEQKSLFSLLPRDLYRIFRCTMATLLLSTSCAPLQRSSTPSHGGGSAPIDPISATSDRPSVDNNGSGAVSGKNGCVTTEQTADNAAGDATNFLDGGHYCQHHASSSIVNSNSQDNSIGGSSHVETRPQQGGQRVEILDKLTALPVQCDITIVPRAQHPSDLSSVNNASSLDSNDTSNSSRVDVNGGGESDVMMQPVRITQQNFHPCGMDNIVRLADGSVTTSDFILSLANCGVRVGGINEHEDGKKRIRLPVQAIPSSLSIPSFHNNVEEDTMGHHRDNLSNSYSRGEKHTVEEVAISFDFSMAVDVYQQRFDEISTAEKLNHSKLHPTRVQNPSWNADGTTILNEQNAQDFSKAHVKNMEINSIMSTLEEESQFIKKTLFILGSFGCGLFLCMVWTIYKLERGRRSRRKVHVKRVLVENVPSEIIGTPPPANNNATTMTNNTGTTTTKSREGGVTSSSLRSHPSLQSNGRAHFLEEISPIRSSSSVSLDEAEEEEEEEVEEQADDAVAAVVSEAKTAVHETLHLITPQDVITVTGSTSSNSNERQKSSSPRHWYEDFLSPKGCSKKAARNNRTDNAVLSGHEEVARSLFCSSSSSSDCNKESPSMGNKDSLDTSKGGTSSSSSMLNAPKKKVLVTPIERASLKSPPPSDVSLLKLSNDIESTISPLMISTETEGTHESSTSGEFDDPKTSCEEDIDKEEHCTVTPTSTAANEESSKTIKPSCTPINTPKPKSSRILKTPATDISISSEESQASASLRARKIFAQELAKKALSPPNAQKTNFSTSIARRAAEVQTPKEKLTPLSASSSLCDDEPSPFLDDYW